MPTNCHQQLQYFHKEELEKRYEQGKKQQKHVDLDEEPRVLVAVLFGGEARDREVDAVLLYCLLVSTSDGLLHCGNLVVGGLDVVLP